MVAVAPVILTRFEIGLLVGSIVGIGTSLLGIFIIMKHLALAGDALSHVALPGIGIAVAVGINPFLGALIALLLGVILIIEIDRRTAISLDAAVGIVLSTSLALGVLFFSSAESLMESLFGSIFKLTAVDALIGLTLGLGVIVVTLIKFKDLIHLSLSKELAQSEGIDVEKDEFLLLFLLAVMVAVGIKIVGVLLLGALVVIPAAAARNIGVGMRAVAILTVAFGLSTVITGVTLASRLQLPSGPMVVFANVVIFAFSLFWSGVKN